MTMRVLVIEDDPMTGKALRTGFAESGVDCDWLTDGVRGLEQARSRQFDAIVLDQLLPGLDGREVLRALRDAGIQTPVILLTALGTVQDRVRGLQGGADDYLIKPFDFAELIARLQAVCRRAVTRPAPVLEVGDLRLDLARRRVTRGGRDVELSPTEFSLLEFLMRHAGQVVTRKMLCEHLWRADWDGVTNVVEVHINRLRAKMDRGCADSAVQTVRGRGYAIRTA
jgi:two-component system OmpR family response regulator/two-component system copper resistance phosphate regulon response regulator CusR